MSQKPEIDFIDPSETYTDLVIKDITVGDGEEAALVLLDERLSGGDALRLGGPADHSFEVRWSVCAVFHEITIAHGTALVN